MPVIVPGNRGGKVLVNDGYRYQKNRTRNNAIYWRCWRAECRAPLQTNIFNMNDENPNIVVLNVGNHFHQADNQIIDEATVRNRMVVAVAADPSKTCRQVYDDVAVTVDQENVPAFSAVKTILERQRSKHIPQIPQTIDDVVIQGQWRRTRDGERFCSLVDNNWGIAIFTTLNSLRCLGQCADFYLDGTFRTCPHPYRQFFTIHGLYQDRVIPFVFVLMTGKEIGQYPAVFSHIKRKYLRLTNNQLLPNKIVSDFEIAMMNATETEFPQSDICGCLFHLCQSIWRRVQRLGLRRPYERNQNLRTCVRKVMALAYLPVLLVRANFVQLCRENVTRLLCRRYPALRDLLAYFRGTYLDGQFPVRMWNVYQRTMDNRTNNHIESFNRRWNTDVGRRHPNLWFFLNKLRKEEMKTRLAINHANNGRAPPTRKRKYRDLERRVKRLRRSYRRGLRNLTQYWNAMTHVVATFH